jgi:hypothetical protein
MAINHKDLDGLISVYDFTIVFGTAAMSADKQKLVINYTGYAFPELAAVELDTYEYSLDNGATWTAMTPSGTTQLTGLAFTETGTAQTFEWMAKEDEGTAFYNQTLRVRINAVEGFSETGLISTSYYIERATTNLASEAAMASQFPDSYPGMSGNELMRNLAPRL